MLRRRRCNAAGRPPMPPLPDADAATGPARRLSGPADAHAGRGWWPGYGCLRVTRAANRVLTASRQVTGLSPACHRPVSPASNAQTVGCSRDAGPSWQTPKTCLELLFLKCPRQDWNLRPLDPQSDIGRIWLSCNDSQREPTSINRILPLAPITRHLSFARGWIEVRSKPDLLDANEAIWAFFAVDRVGYEEKSQARRWIPLVRDGRR